MALASTAFAGTTYEITTTVNTQNAIQTILTSGSVSDSDVLFFSSEGPYNFSTQVSTPKNLALRGESVTPGQPPATILKKTTEVRFFEFSADCGGDGGGIKNLQFNSEIGPGVINVGGAFYVAGSLLGGIENAIFSKNYSTGPGGAVFANKFSGDVVNSSFFENHAAHNGGAVFAGQFGGNIKNSIFSRNHSTVCAGALYAGNINGGTKLFCDLGGTKFLSNSSVEGGGAITVVFDGYLGALSGDVIFQGNKATGGELPNAIFCKNFEENDIIGLAAATGKTFYLYDPISSYSSSGYRELTIAINPESSHMGTVLLDQYRSAMYFESPSGATVSHGTFALHNGASFGSESNTGTFTLESAATLRVAYGQETKEFSCEIGESGSYTVSESVSIPTYYAQSTLSEIAASTVDLRGKLHFVLPPNAVAGNVMLHTTGTVHIGGAEVLVDPASTVAPGDSLVLINASQSLMGTPKNRFCGAMQAPYGASLLHAFELSTTQSQLLATFTLIPSPRATLLPAGQCNSLLLLNRCGDLIGDGIASIAAGEADGTKRFKEFAVADFASERYKADCSTELRAREMLAGLAVGSGKAALRWTAGGFLSCGSASCRSDLDDGSSARGAGKNKFLGGGALLRAASEVRKCGAIYLEASACGGRISNEWHSDDLRDLRGRRASYDCVSPYCGAHGAVGCQWQSSKIALDLRGKYLWTKLAGESLTLSTGDPVDFQPMESSRISLGAKLSLPPRGNFRPYGGFALERELSGDAEANTYGLAIAPLSLRGSSCLCEIGFAYKSTALQPLSVDFGFRSHLGTRRGADGTIRACLEF